MSISTRIERLEVRAAALGITEAELQAMFTLKALLARFNMTLLDSCHELTSALQEDVRTADAIEQLWIAAGLDYVGGARKAGAIYQQWIGKVHSIDDLLAACRTVFEACRVEPK